MIDEWLLTARGSDNKAFRFRQESTLDRDGLFCWVRETLTHIEWPYPVRIELHHEAIEMVACERTMVGPTDVDRVAAEIADYFFGPVLYTAEHRA